MPSSCVSRARHALVSALVVILAVSFTGCATFKHIAHYPTPEKTATVAVANKPLSKARELPVGAYYDKDHHVVVTGHQKGVLTSALLFGVVGVMIAGEVNKSSGRDKFSEEISKGGDLNAVLAELLTASLTDHTASRWNGSANKAALELTPFAVFTVEKTGQARLYAMLNATLSGIDGKAIWSGRYFARVPGLYPLDQTGWMNEGRFTQGMRLALSRVLAACIDDTHGRLNGLKKVTAKGRYAYFNTDIELRAIVVQEKPDYVVAKLIAGDVLVMAGTHLLDRTDYEIKPAEFKDPRK